MKDLSCILKKLKAPVFLGMTIKKFNNLKSLMRFLPETEQKWYNNNVFVMQHVEKSYES